MLDSLVHRKDGDIACPPQTTVTEKRLQGAQGLVVAIGILPNPIDLIRPGEMQSLFGDSRTGMAEKAFSLRAQGLNNLPVIHDNLRKTGRPMGTLYWI